MIGPAAAALLTRCPACGDAHHRRGTLALQLTTDGGEHWTEAAGPRQFLPLVGAFGPVGVSFPTAERGYVLAMAGTGPPRLRLLGTHDGGRTWTALAVP